MPERWDDRVVFKQRHGLHNQRRRPHLAASSVLGRWRQGAHRGSHGVPLLSVARPCSGPSFIQSPATTLPATLGPNPGLTIEAPRHPLSPRATGHPSAGRIPTHRATLRGPCLWAVCVCSQESGGRDRERAPKEVISGLAEVRVGENESFESALRRFNKKIQQSGILAEARRREHYEKPSVKRKRKEAKRKKVARQTQS